MLDRSKIKKMWVWNDDQDEVDRYVIDIFSDGSCLAVPKFDEYMFENGGKYVTLNYLHYKEITEDKYRPFKAEEITEKFFDYLFRKKGSTFITKIIGIRHIDNNCIYINNNWISVFDLYGKWEMAKPTLLILSDVKIKKAYTNWMPAGVKE